MHVFQQIQNKLNVSGGIREFTCPGALLSCSSQFATSSPHYLHFDVNVLGNHATMKMQCLSSKDKKKNNLDLYMELSYTIFYRRRPSRP